MAQDKRQAPMWQVTDGLLMHAPFVLNASRQNSRQPRGRLLNPGDALIKKTADGNLPDEIGGLGAQ
jgi:hypothetical protein